MSNYLLESSDDTLLLKLSGELGVEQVRVFHQALRDALRPGKTLRVDATALVRIDSAALQTLLAAADYASAAQLTAPSPALDEGLCRYALESPFSFAG
jgi:anti-anti-sigma regulatory factor